jgi:hypothetical protein
VGAAPDPAAGRGARADDGGLRGGGVSERSRVMLLLGEAWLLEYRLRRDFAPVAVVIMALHRRLRRQRKALEMVS